MISPAGSTRWKDSLIRSAGTLPVQSTRSSGRELSRAEHAGQRPELAHVDGRGEQHDAAHRHRRVTGHAEHGHHGAQAVAEQVDVLGSRLVEDGAHGSREVLVAVGLERVLRLDRVGDTPVEQVDVVARVEEAADEAVVLLQVEDLGGGDQAHHEQDRRRQHVVRARRSAGSGRASPCRAATPAGGATGSRSGGAARSRCESRCARGHRCAAPTRRRGRGRRRGHGSCVRLLQGPVALLVLDPLAQLAQLSLQGGDLDQHPVDVAAGREVEQVPAACATAPRWCAPRRRAASAAARSRPRPPDGRPRHAARASPGVCAPTTAFCHSGGSLMPTLLPTRTASTRAGEVEDQAPEQCRGVVHRHVTGAGQADLLDAGQPPQQWPAVPRRRG